MRTATSIEFKYEGTELDLFLNARNWKAYWSQQIIPFLHGDVLEVGAGAGANTDLFAKVPLKSWTSLEPDPVLAGKIRFPLGLPGSRAVGTLADLPATRLFDAILYIDVLEHIENDTAEMALAAAHLRPGGVVVVLSPAHPFLYTPFDAAIGHFRRYLKPTLEAAAPRNLDLLKLTYLDSAGLLASLGNRLLLKQSSPTESQILFWDRLLVPLSTLILDRITFGMLGKSLLGVWRKSN